MSKSYHIVSLPGDGVGPEVLHEAFRVMRQVASACGFQFEVEEQLMGGAALDATGVPFPEATQEACGRADAVFLGAVGGPAWDDRTGDLRPESGLLQLRKQLGTYANLRPVAVPEALAASSPLRQDAASGTDMLIVRELTGGIYFGQPKDRTEVNGERAAFNTMVYSEGEIRRIAEVAFEWARKRRNKVTLVDKANVLVVSQLWREVVPEVHQSYPDVTLEYLYVDNAAMQVVLHPRQFDVILTANLFGDILSDLAATLPGSLGMLPSASLGGSCGLFEPVHGSAPDIAGQGIANPMAAILSASMMLDALGEAEAAAAMREGVDQALAAGYRTRDLASPDCQTLSTSEMGQHIAQFAEEALTQEAT